MSVLAIPASCGRIWCGKKIVEISQRMDAEKHPVGRTCLKVIGYASMTLGLLVGVAGSILLTAGSTLTLGLIGFSYGGTVGSGIGIAVGIGLGAASAYKIGCVFHRALCELNQKRDLSVVIS